MESRMKRAREQTGPQMLREEIPQYRDAPPRQKEGHDLLRRDRRLTGHHTVTRLSSDTMQPVVRRGRYVMVRRILTPSRLAARARPVSGVARQLRMRVWRACGPAARLRMGSLGMAGATPAQVSQPAGASGPRGTRTRKRVCVMTTRRHELIRLDWPKGLQRSRTTGMEALVATHNKTLQQGLRTLGWPPWNARRLRPPEAHGHARLRIFRSAPGRWLLIHRLLRTREDVMRGLGSLFHRGECRRFPSSPALQRRLLRRYQITVEQEEIGPGLRGPPQDRCHHRDPLTLGDRVRQVQEGFYLRALRGDRVARRRRSLPPPFPKVGGPTPPRLTTAGRALQDVEHVVWRQAHRAVEGPVDPLAGDVLGMYRQPFSLMRNRPPPSLTLT